ncbi:Uncharacterised protein g11304 [Pycnogonum litorale]
MSAHEKRKPDNLEEQNEEDHWIGPLPSEAIKSKKRKVLEFEHIYLDNLPNSETYEKSYMHRDVITQVICTK